MSCELAKHEVYMKSFNQFEILKPNKNKSILPLKYICTCIHVQWYMYSIHVHFVQCIVYMYILYNVKLGK